jgi:4-alpha-glucanotransferase
VDLPRSSGILLHPSSLPGGRLGDEAFRFVDWLQAAGQSWWQMLPLGPPDELGSPYAASSAFAASPALLAGPRAPVSEQELAAFRRRNAYWAADWERLGGNLGHQVRFQREWSALREYAAGRGVRLIGDVPIYVAAGSADHVSHPELFVEDWVAGAPPDALGPLGQHWGNPLFDWKAVRAEGYRWWIERLRRTFDLFDLTRIDHFRGFAAYWAIPAGAEDARAGHWEKGPGESLFRAARKELGRLPVIAEDLGVITPDVERLRDRLRFPGMVVQIWAYSRRKDSPHRFENHRARSVLYTSTHDTTTLKGAFPTRDHWPLLEQGLGSKAALTIVQAQDVLGLGDDARMNRPGEPYGNWQWRLEPGQLTPEHAARLRDSTRKAGRLPASAGATLTA